jgi:hypothetical protein
MDVTCFLLEFIKKMGFMTALTFGFLFLLALITCVMVSWVVISHDRFTDIELKPNMEYQIKDRKYIFPDINIEGKCLLLKELVIENLRLLMIRVHNLLDYLHIGYHVSGGTLLGIQRHSAIPGPWDDDLDIATEIANRNFMFSPEFKKTAADYGLQTQFLAGTTLERADRHGAAVRLQLLNSTGQETCDVFFIKQDGPVVYKVDGWLKENLVYNGKEQFSANDVYPRKIIEMDGLIVCLPNNPMNLLVKQYGNDVMTHAKIRPRLISHAFPMKFLQALWLPNV